MMPRLSLGTMSTGDHSGAVVTYVAVSAATLWTDPDRPRPVDASALTNPVDLSAWLADMTLAEKFGLSEKNLTQTQALYGDPVRVLSEQGDWCRIVVPRQTTPKNPLGYPGWVPKVQLTDDPEFAAALARGPAARVDVRTAWLHHDELLRSAAMQISFNTRLPLLDRVEGAVAVQTPDHGARWMNADDVRCGDASQGSAGPRGADLVEAATKFLGLPYLWGGRSGFGIDCSGLTSVAYEAGGLELPRDASAQARDAAGRRVADSDLQAGDLLFWASDNGVGAIHHVAMYTDEGHMVEAPGSADPVRITPVRFDSEYWGARRFLSDG
jgi:cell wall-associated NlpC family hydrolase